MSAPQVDLAFIGGGLSTTATLSHLAGFDLPLRVTLFDRGGHFGGGLTYSGPAAAGTLLLNPLAQMPTAFSDWIASRSPDWLAHWAQETSAVAVDWLTRDAAALSQCAQRPTDKSALEGLFVPRALYGRFLQDRLKDTERRIVASGGQVIRMAAPVKTMRTAEAGFVINDTCLAQQVVLAPGIIPKFPLPHALSYMTQSPEALVRDLARRAQAGNGRVVIAGANAAAMDVIYTLATQREAARAITDITIVAPSGRLPQGSDGGSDGGMGSGTAAPDDLLLFTRSADTADGLVADLRADVARLRAAGLSSHVLTDLGASAAIARSLRAMPAPERAKALARDGGDLSQISRRAVPAYAQAVADLQAAGQLHIKAGAITAVTQSEAGIRVSIADHPDLAAAALVDCRASGGTLNETSDEFLRQLPALAHPGPFGRGLEVDDSFCAAPGLYVMGDLLTGYDGSAGMVWHLQSAPRIEVYAERLARELSVVLSGRGRSRKTS